MSLEHPFAPAPTAANFALLIEDLRAAEKATVELCEAYEPGAEPRQRALDEWIFMHHETQRVLEAMLQQWIPLGRPN